jgi:carbohydrate-selective porin OprB
LTLDPSPSLPNPPDDPETDAPAPDDPGFQAHLSFTGAVQAALGARPLARPTASYDLQLSQALWNGASVAGRLEGAAGGGLDAALETLGGVNEHAAGDRPVVLTELWLDQAFDDGQINLSLGKLDLRHGFDGRRPAAQEDRTFLSPLFQNDPTIPFPDNGMAVRVELARWGWPYYAIGVANAEAGRDTTGFEDLERGRALWLHELGIRTKVGKLAGNYRVIFWRRTDDPLDPLTGRRAGDRNGSAFGFRQDLPGRFTAFGRLGVAEADAPGLATHGSLGLLRHEPIRGRPLDAVGLALGRTKPAAKSDRPNDGTETRLEAFYRAAVSDHFELTFDVQVIDNSAGDRDAGPQVVLGLRGRVSF